jgi:hypothetical protein
MLIPRSPLQKRIEKRAGEIAHDRVARTLHSMHLEDQAPTMRVDKREVLKVRNKLLESNWKQLWE